MTARGAGALRRHHDQAKRKGRIFIDYLRNASGDGDRALLAARAPGRTRRVAARLEERCRASSRRNEITLANFRRRLAAADPWSDYAKTDQTLGSSALKALGIDA